MKRLSSKKGGDVVGKKAPGNLEHNYGKIFI